MRTGFGQTGPYSRRAGFGTLAIQVNQLDIAEINLTRAGVTAEFGRTAGTVANAVSRSGSNRLAAWAVRSCAI